MDKASYARFVPAYRYVNDKLEGKGLGDIEGDSGGLTWCGIARNKHPNWGGWIIIDDYLSHGGIIKNAWRELGERLTPDTMQWFFEQFWEKGGAGKVAAVSHDNGIEVYDVNINAGSHGVRFLQRALNIMNRNQQDYPDMKEDDRWGPKTEAALRIALDVYAPDGDVKVLDRQNFFQEVFLIDQMKKEPHKEKWRGWFTRCINHRRLAQSRNIDNDAPDKENVTRVAMQLAMQSALKDIRTAQQTLEDHV